MSLTSGKKRRRPAPGGGRWPPSRAYLERLIKEATVDAYGESEQRSGFPCMLEEKHSRSGRVIRLDVQAARLFPCSLHHFQYSFELHDLQAARRFSGALGPPNSSGCRWSRVRSPSFFDRSFSQTAHR